MRFEIVDIAINLNSNGVERLEYLFWAKRTEKVEFHSGVRGVWPG